MRITTREQAMWRYNAVQGACVLCARIKKEKESRKMMSRTELGQVVNVDGIIIGYEGGPPAGIAAELKHAFAALACVEEDNLAGAKLELELWKGLCEPELEP